MLTLILRNGVVLETHDNLVNVLQYIDIDSIAAIKIEQFTIVPTTEYLFVFRGDGTQVKFDITDTILASLEDRLQAW